METAQSFRGRVVEDLARLQAGSEARISRFASHFGIVLGGPAPDFILHNSGISLEKALRWGFDCFVQESPEQAEAARRILRILEDWESEPQSVFIYGFTDRHKRINGNGVGKSHLLVAMAVRLVKRYKVGLKYWPMRELVRAQGAWLRCEDRDGLPEPIKEAAAAEVLALDDFDKGRFDPRTSTGLYRDIVGLFDERFDRKRPTLISSNYTLQEIEEHWLGASVSSRLANAAQIYVIGRDRRATNGT